MKLMDIERYINELENCMISKTCHYDLTFTDKKVFLKTVGALKNHVDVIEVVDNEEEYNQGIYKATVIKSE